MNLERFIHRKRGSPDYSAYVANRDTSGFPYKHQISSCRYLVPKIKNPKDVKGYIDAHELYP